jgi:hypothetical protein
MGENAEKIGLSCAFIAVIRDICYHVATNECVLHSAPQTPKWYSHLAFVRFAFCCRAT